MKDIPTPESDAAKFVSEYITQEDVVPYELSQSLEQRLAIAVAALQSISEYWRCARTMTDACEHNRNAAAEALAQILEDETLGELRGELLLRCCIEICQEESTDNGTAQKIEARIRALKRDVRAVSNVTFKRSE